MSASTASFWARSTSSTFLVDSGEIAGDLVHGLLHGKLRHDPRGTSQNGRVDQKRAGPLLEFDECLDLALAGVAGNQITGHLTPALIIFAVLVVAGTAITYVLDRQASSYGSPEADGTVDTRNPKLDSEISTVDRTALVAAIKAICVKYGFASVDSMPAAKIHRARLEHLPGDGEDIIVFHRWWRFINEDKSIAFTTRGVRIREGHRRIDFPYQRIQEYEFESRTEYNSAGFPSAQIWFYLDASKASKVEFTLKLYGGSPPRPAEVVACIQEIRDLFRRGPVCGSI